MLAQCITPKMDRIFPVTNCLGWRLAIAVFGPRFDSFVGLFASRSNHFGLATWLVRFVPARSKHSAKLRLGRWKKQQEKATEKDIERKRFALKLQNFLTTAMHHREQHEPLFVAIAGLSPFPMLTALQLTILPPAGILILLGKPGTTLAGAARWKLPLATSLHRQIRANEGGPILPRGLGGRNKDYRYSSLPPPTSHSRGPRTLFFFLTPSFGRLASNSQQQDPPTTLPPLPK